MVKLLRWAVLLSGASSVGAFNYLDEDNWDVTTAGKTMLIEFMEPECEVCKSIKPWWEKLVRNWNKPERVKTTMMATVNCAKAQDLCGRLGIDAHPKFMWGNVIDLEEYTGEKTYDDLKKFALEHLKPVCGPTHLDLCDSDTKKELEGYVNIPIADLRKKIKDKEAEKADAIQMLNNTVNELNDEIRASDKKAQAIIDEKDKAVNKIIDEEGLGFMRAVAAEHGPPPMEDPDRDKDFDDDEVKM